VQVVAPDQAIGLQFGRAEADPIDDLRGQVDDRVVVAEAGVLGVPAERVALNRYVAEARRRAKERRLVGKLRPIL